MAYIDRLTNSFRDIVPPTMGKHKKDRNKKPAPAPLPQVPLKARMKPFFNFLKGAIALFLALVIFWPRPTVELIPATDPQNPTSASFIITNSTFLVPLDNVTVGMGICQSVTEPSIFHLDFHCTTDDLTTFTTNEWSHLHLGPDEKFGLSFGQVIHLAGGAKFAGADLAAIVKYHWWFVPYEFHKTFRFVTKREEDGTTRWYSRPSDHAAKSAAY